MFLLEELLAGATGAMTGFAFPEILVQIVSLYRAGRVDEAADVFYRAVPLMRFEFQEGIGMAIRKEVLHRAARLPARRRARPAPRSTRRRARRSIASGVGRGEWERGTWHGLNQSWQAATPTVQSDSRRGMDLGLKGKVAMVAGASRGLGFAVAQALASEGALVSIASRDEASIGAAAKRLGCDQVLATPLDVRSAEGIAALDRGRRKTSSAASICCSPTPAARRPARRCRSTTRRGRARSICCCSARCGWCARPCRR